MPAQPTVSTPPLSIAGPIAVMVCCEPVFCLLLRSTVYEQCCGWPGSVETEKMKLFPVPANCRKLIHRWRDRQRLFYGLLSFGASTSPNQPRTGLLSRASRRRKDTAGNPGDAHIVQPPGRISPPPILASASGNSILSHPFVTGSESADIKKPVSGLDCWRPRRDSNPCYRRERAMS
jgi:hypothetical protein